jgi:hypothetical protein
LHPTLIMNFTNIASFAAILIASVQAANFTAGQNSTDPVASSAVDPAPNSTTTTTNPDTATTTTFNASNVTPDSSIDDKVQKIMSLRLRKFGDLHQKIVQSFLKAEEWGRLDYHFNEDPLSVETLRKVISVPSTSLTASEKADRIMALIPTPHKMGDLKVDMVADILTPEEWGKIDFVDNNEPIDSGRIIEILSK